MAITSDAYPLRTRIDLFLRGELVAALRADKFALFRRWLPGVVQDQGFQSDKELVDAVSD